jgi:hypothetical protein
MGKIIVQISGTFGETKYAEFRTQGYGYAKAVSDAIGWLSEWVGPAVRLDHDLHEIGEKPTFGWGVSLTDPIPVSKPVGTAGEGKLLDKIMKRPAGRETPVEEEFNATMEETRRQRLEEVDLRKSQDVCEGTGKHPLLNVGVNRGQCAHCGFLCDIDRGLIVAHWPSPKKAVPPPCTASGGQWRFANGSLRGKLDCPDCAARVEVIGGTIQPHTGLPEAHKAGAPEEHVLPLWTACPGGGTIPEDKYKGTGKAVCLKCGQWVLLHHDHIAPHALPDDENTRMDHTGDAVGYYLRGREVTREEYLEAHADELPPVTDAGPKKERVISVAVLDANTCQTCRDLHLTETIPPHRQCENLIAHRMRTDGSEVGCRCLATSQKPLTGKT